MKTKIIFENQNSEQKSVCKEFENEIKKSFFIALKEKKLLTQAQYEECIKKL